MNLFIQSKLQMVSKCRNRKKFISIMAITVLLICIILNITACSSGQESNEFTFKKFGLDNAVINTYNNLQKADNSSLELKEIINAGDRILILLLYP